MFHALGNWVSRGWPLWLAAWAVLIGAVWAAAPAWQDVAQDQEFAFLPATMPSRQGEELFQKAFPNEQVGSNIVVVITREEAGGLRPADRAFIQDTLRTGLLKIAAEEGGLASESEPTDADPFSTEPVPVKVKSIISRLRTPDTPGTGGLLLSADNQAVLIVAELTTEFLSAVNWPTIQKIKHLIADLQHQGRVPAGLNISLTGSAVLGQDRTVAQLQSAQAAGFWTVVLVIGLLLVIYRAPLLALIPLVTVYLAVELSLKILAILAKYHYVTLFEGIQIYITVVAYGAGVDYCLFLTARYKEELDRGASYSAALAEAIGKVGAALTASAATVMFGIGMMIFAKFGKFHQAGIAMPLSLFIVLCATLTFTTSLLRLVGRWAFWPQQLGSAREARWLPRRWKHLFAPGRLHASWERGGEFLLQHPGTVLLATVGLMLPFAGLAVGMFGRQSYDWIENLPADAPSVQGTRTLQTHFPGGLMGPVTVLIVNPHTRFDQPAGHALIERLTEQLSQRRAELGLADLRTLSKPLGVTGAGERSLQQLQFSQQDVEEGIQREARGRYLTDLGERGNVGTRLDLLFEQNPFSSGSIANLQKIKELVPTLLPAEFLQDAQFYYIGATASSADLMQVTNGDQWRIESLVLASVLLILLLLLRQVVISCYLIVSVLFSYYTTLGVTLVCFWALNPQTFAGLDWKVGLFLFTILIAVGEDYNIFLMTRIKEEQQRHGKVRGVIVALTHTGPIISSCGIIMAGTFVSLTAGSLNEMKQLGFALALGVLLDTFVVRPVLVPAFMVLLLDGRLNPTHWFAREQSAGKVPQQSAR